MSQTLVLSRAWEHVAKQASSVAKAAAFPAQPQPAPVGAGKQPQAKAKARFLFDRG